MNFKRSELIAAIYAGDVSFLKNNLKNRKLSSIPDLSKSNLLKIALRHKKVEAANILLNSGVKLSNNCDQNLRHTSLHLAVRIGDRELVSRLIENGADPNCRGKSDMTPLHSAVLQSRYEIMKVLIENGANVASKCSGSVLNGYTALHFACETDQIQCVRLLIKLDSSLINPKEDVIHPIHLSVFYNNFKITELLLRYIDNVNIRFRNEYFDRFFSSPVYSCEFYGSYTLLHCALRIRSFNLTKLLLEHGACLRMTTSTKKTPLMIAVETNDPSLVDLLLKHQEVKDSINDLDLDGRNALHSVFCNYVSMISPYSSREFNSADAKLEIIKLLIKEGINLNTPMTNPHFSYTAYTPLTLAVNCGYKHIVRYLLDFIEIDLEQINEALLRSAMLFDMLLPPNTVTDINYINNLKKEFKEIGYDLIKAVLKTQLIGAELRPETQRVITERFHDMDVNDAEFADIVNKIRQPLENMVKKMKQEVLGDSRISVWHLVTCSTNTLVKYAGNEVVTDFFSRIEDYKDKYSSYFYMLKSRLEKAVNKSKEIEENIEVLFEILGDSLTYDECEMIVSFM